MGKYNLSVLRVTSTNFESEAKLVQNRLTNKNIFYKKLATPFKSKKKRKDKIISGHAFDHLYINITPQCIVFTRYLTILDTTRVDTGINFFFYIQRLSKFTVKEM